MSNKDLSYRQVMILAIVSCFLWSTAFAGIKVGLKYWPPLTFAGIRFMLSGILLVPFWIKNSKNSLSQIKDQLGLILTICLLQTYLLYLLFYLGISMVSGAITAIIIGLSPLITATLAHVSMHNDKLSKQKLMSLLVGFGGIVIISLSCKPWKNKGALMLLGIGFLLLGSISSGYANIIIAKAKKLPGIMFLTSIQIFTGGLFLLCTGLIFEKAPSFNVPLEFYISLSWLSILSAVAFSIWFKLLNQPKVKPSELNMWKFIIPVFGSILSWIIIPEESPNIASIAGMALVAISIVIYFLNKVK